MREKYAMRKKKCLIAYVNLIKTKKKKINKWNTNRKLNRGKTEVCVFD